MRNRKTYGQFCALARALDRVGDRWTLLLVRELLLGPARYGDLAAALPGLATNLLAERLRRLTADGIVERDGPAYRLTSRGRALEPVVHELIRWGAAYMTEGPGEDAVDERWAELALRALLQSPGAPARQGTVAVRCGDRRFAVVADRDGRRVQVGAGPADATVTAPLPALLAAVATGEWTGAVTVDGDAGLARAVLAAAPGRG